MRGLFIAIASAHCNEERRRAVRETWLPRLLPAMTARFFVGQGPAVEEPNLVQLEAPDGYFQLWEKMREAMRYALCYEWDYYFKCDDDTYVVPERLDAALDAAYLAPKNLTRPGNPGPKRVGSEPEYVGTTWSPEGNPSLYAHGGAGYFLTRRIVEFILRRSVPCPNEAWGEDGWVGCHARKTTRFYMSPYLYHERDRWPLQSNNLATCHRVYGLEAMRQIHAQFLEGI